MRFGPALRRKSNRNAASECVLTWGQLEQETQICRRRVVVFAAIYPTTQSSLPIGKPTPALLAHAALPNASTNAS
jgi:hypothetical protein